MQIRTFFLLTFKIVLTSFAFPQQIPHAHQDALVTRPMLQGTLRMIVSEPGVVHTRSCGRRGGRGTICRHAPAVQGADLSSCSARNTHLSLSFLMQLDRLFAFQRRVEWLQVAGQDAALDI